MPRVLTAAILTLSTAGCFVADSGDMHASWSITQGAAAGTCAAIGGDTVEIIATRVTGDRIYQELFDCDDLAATITDVRPGRYDVEVTLYDAAGNALSEPFSVPVDVSSNAVVELGHFEFNFPAAGPPGGGGDGGEGRFAASWIISVNGQPATCEDVGAVAVEIVSEGPEGAAERHVDRTDCAEMAAETDLLPAGAYVVSVDLLDGDGHMLNSVPVGGTLPLPGGQTVNVGDFEFAFSYHSAVFAVHFGSDLVQGGNCSSTHPDGGAGVVLQDVMVYRKGETQCLLVDISGIYDASGERKSTPSCMPYSCQHAFVVHSLDRLQDGEYVMQVRGYLGREGATPKICYLSGDVPFTVSGADRDLGVIYAPLDDSLSPGSCTVP